MPILSCARTVPLDGWAMFPTSDLLVMSARR